MQSTLISPRNAQPSHNQQNRANSVIGHTPSYSAHSAYVSTKFSPKKQEWSILSNHQAQQHRLMKQLQKRQNSEKVQKYKYQIQKQLQNKSSMSINEKQEDRKYYQYIKDSSRIEQERQNRDRLNKILEYRRVNQENFQKAEQMKKKSSKGTDFVTQQNPGVGLIIGEKSEHQRKMEEYIRRKQLTDALDRQLMTKQQQKLTQKLNDNLIYQNNKKYMQLYYQKRDSVSTKRSQNQQVYRYYEKLNQQKEQKEKELYKKIINQQIRKKQQKQYNKQRQKQEKKSYLQRQLKSQLQNQMRYKSQQNLKQKRYNPEQNSYGIIKGIFKNRTASYDKKQYFQYLARQAEQQNLQKKKWDFMNDQEYRLNMNQLNKAVNGSYEHERYLDRSVNRIGQPNGQGRGASSVSFDIGPTKIAKDQDLLAVNYKLDQIRKKKQETPSFKHSRNMSFNL